MIQQLFLLPKMHHPQRARDAAVSPLSRTPPPSPARRRACTRAALLLAALVAAGPPQSVPVAGRCAAHACGRAAPPGRPSVLSAAPPARDSDCTHTICYVDASILLTGAWHCCMPWRRSRYCHHLPALFEPSCTTNPAAGCRCAIVRCLRGPLQRRQ